MQELGGKKVTVFSQITETSKISTIIIRGPTQNIIDDVERALDDAVNAYKALTRDPTLVAGAGALEVCAAVWVEWDAECRAAVRLGGESHGLALSLIGSCR